MAPSPRGNHALKIQTSVVVLVALLLAGSECSTLLGGSLDKVAYGVGLTVDSLANLEIGRFAGRMVSYRFRANHSGAVSAVRIYLIFRKVCDGCYANGTGGSVTVQVRTDDGSERHLASNTVLASALVRDPMTEWNRLVSFEKPAALDQGKIYHIVFSNPAVDPERNYVSIDDLYTAADGSDLQPATAASEFAVLLKLTGSSPWQVRPQHVPIVDVTYQDGHHQGQGYMDVKRDSVVLGAGDAVRELFSMAEADRRVSKCVVRLERTTGSGTVSFELQNDEGQKLQSGSLDLSKAAGNAGWGIGEFVAPVWLKNSGHYSLVLKAENGAGFRISPLQRGSQYGFAKATVLEDGRCEVRMGPLWTGCLGRGDLDIPFYLQ